LRIPICQSEINAIEMAFNKHVSVPRFTYLYLPPERRDSRRVLRIEQQKDSPRRILFPWSIALVKTSW
jgi:hypothetical protein